MEELEDQICDDKNPLKENDEEQERIKAIIEQLDDINNDTESRKNELAMHRQVVKKQRNMPHEDLSKQNSIRELKEMLIAFDAQKRKKRDPRGNGQFPDATQQVAETRDRHPIQDRTFASRERCL
jgi:hypothetical protein